MSPLANSSFERLFQAHAEPLYAFLVYRTGDRQLAEDLLADTFERALRSRARFDPRKGSERNWVYAIAVNLVRDRARRDRVETNALERVGAFESRRVNDGALGAIEERDSLRCALSKLRDDEREALGLRFGADLKLREVARVLGERQSTVEKRIARALEKLRHQLQSQE